MIDETEKCHRLLMEILLEVILRREPITYKGVYLRAREKEKDETLRKRMFYHGPLAKVLGGLNDLIQKRFPEKKLTISSLVVSKAKKLPNDGIAGFPGFEGWRNWDEGKRRKKTALHQELVFAAQYWNEVYEDLFSRVPRIRNQTKHHERDGKTPRGIQGSGGEGKDHARLKEYVARHPNKFGITKVVSVEKEYELRSADKVDVGFFQKDKTTLVEVKSRISSDVDLKRGIYQCVKYRAVYCAWWLDKIDVTEASDFVSVMLVTERNLPQELVELARKLKIKHKTIRLRA